MHKKSNQVSLLRLSIPLFFQWFGMGATYPILSHYLLQDLHFTALQVGVITSLSAVSAIVSPIVGAIIADHWVSSHRLYSICNLFAGIISILLADETGYQGFLVLYFLSCLTSGPAIVLIYSIVFHSISAKQKERFALVRVWATVGWLAVAWSFGYFWLRSGNPLNHSFLLAGYCYLFLAAYGLTLPSTRIYSQKAAFAMKIPAMSVIGQKPVILLLTLAFASSFMDRYYFFGTAPYLKLQGISDAEIMPLMSVGQFIEVFAMTFMLFMFRVIGPRVTMAIGFAAHLMRFALFSLSINTISLVVALACHGIAYAWGFTVIQIQIDRFCSKENRAGVQFVFALATSGLASILASNFAGLMLPDQASDYGVYWLVPVIISACSIIVVFILPYQVMTCEPEQPSCYTLSSSDCEKSEVLSVVGGKV